MTDVVQKLGNSLIQHGQHNDRIYLMKLDQTDYPTLIQRLDVLALENNYSKIFAKIPVSCSSAFLSNGYQIEAFVPNFYHGKVQALFLAKYFSESRGIPPKDEIQNLLHLIKFTPIQKSLTMDASFYIEKMAEHDTPKMAELYRKVFQSYPFPIDNSDYLINTMKKDTIYFGIRERTHDTLVALASAEMDLTEFNAEMTDFAVLPECRGKQLALLLLKEMELFVNKLGVKTIYTIARLKSPAMNVTFMKSGYHYTGTLVNNTNISGGLESMNVFYKEL